MNKISRKKNPNRTHTGKMSPLDGLQDLDLLILQGIINSINDPLLIINKDLDIIWNNGAIIENYGDQRGKKCFRFLKPECHTPCSDKSYCVAKETFSDGQKHSHEFCTFSISGEKYHYLACSSPILNKRKSIEAVLLILRDITSRKHMEQDICQLKELNEEIIKIVPIGIQLLDREFRIVYWNPTMEKIMNISAARVQGRKLFEIFPIMVRTEMKTVFEYVRKEGKPFFKQSHRQPMPDGSTIYYNLSIFPLKDRNDQVDCILICLEDITEHKSIENELEKKAQKQARGIKEWEKKFSTLVENCIEGVGISKGGIITYVNPGLAEILGYKKPQELIGKSLKVIYPDDESWEIMQERIERTLQGKPNPPRIEIKARRKDGTAIDLEVSSSDVSLDGELNTLVTIRDITEQKKIAETEKKLHEHILHSDRLAAMGRFAAGIAHEINNPLAVLSGRIQELITEYQHNETLRRNFDSMKRVCDRIGKIVDSLLFFSKQKAEPKYLYKINEVIEDAISMFEMQTVTKGVRLIKRYDQNLPPIVVTASQIQQVCTNMLINAIDATELGDVITISTKLDNNHKNIVITFKDTGCGIPKIYQDKIFDPFFTTKEVDKGSGLGLSISSGIIKDHKGSIRVRSKEGSGTIFTIKLPLPTSEELQRYGLNSSNYSY